MTIACLDMTLLELFKYGDKDCLAWTHLKLWPP